MHTHVHDSEAEFENLFCVSPLLEQESVFGGSSVNKRVVFAKFYAFLLSPRLDVRRFFQVRSFLPFPFRLLIFIIQKPVQFLSFVLKHHKESIA